MEWLIVIGAVLFGLWGWGKLGCIGTDEATRQ